MSSEPENECSLGHSNVMVPHGVIIDEITQKLESVFTTIYRDRMADIPILNDKIEVRAVGFQPWNQSYLGIMITPWFMNVMLLPGKTESWDEQRELSSSTHAFPSGSYEFLVGFEPEIGKYQSCSLFSPMHDFADNNAAIETAEAVMKELMNVENIDEGDINNQQIENIWNGLEATPQDDQSKSADSSQSSSSTTTLTEKMNQPISRRKLLRGALLLDDDND